MSQRARSAGRRPDAPRRNTLGLGERELNLMLDEMDASESVPPERRQRDYVRWPYRRSAVELRLHTGSASERTLHVACRNLSSGGVALLHSSFMHPGTRCEVVLVHPERGPVAIEGTVVRCQHRKGVVHEIGVQFAEPIQALDWVRPEGFAERFSMERVSPETVHGTVVYVDEGAADQRLVVHYLRDTHVRVRSASSGSQAMDLIVEGCDLVLSEFNLPDTDGAALVEQLRESGIRTPVIIVTSDTGDQTRRRLAEVRPSA
ncbi:MAG: response regulator, partial [Myxococcaceae bacterium]|nr:response regulator [Myxococcaceae bacterium]